MCHLEAAMKLLIGVLEGGACVDVDAVAVSCVVPVPCDVFEGGCCVRRSEEAS